MNNWLNLRKGTCKKYWDIFKTSRSFQSKIIASFLILLFLITLLYIIPGYKEYVQAKQISQNAQDVKKRLSIISSDLRELEKLRKTSPFSRKTTSQIPNPFTLIAYADSITATQLTALLTQNQQTSTLSQDVLAQVKQIQQDRTNIQLGLNHPNRYLDKNVYGEVVNQIKETDVSIAQTTEIANFYSNYSKAQVLFTQGVSTVNITLEQNRDIKSVVTLTTKQIDDAKTILQTLQDNEKIPNDLKALSAQTQQTYSNTSSALTQLAQMTQSNQNIKAQYFQTQIVGKIVVDYDQWKKIETKVFSDPKVITAFDTKAQQLTRTINETNQNQSGLQVVVKMFQTENSVVVGNNQPAPQESPAPTAAPISLNDLSINITNFTEDITVVQGLSQKAFTVIPDGANQFSMYGYPTTYGPGINWAISSSGLFRYSVDQSIQVNANIPLGHYKGTIYFYNYKTNTPYKFKDITVTVVAPGTPTNTPIPTSVTAAATPTTSSTNNQPTPTNASQEFQTLRGYYIDGNSNPISLPGFSVTVTDLTTRNTVGAYSSSSWSTGTLIGGHTYRVVATNISGYQVSNMVCYNCTNSTSYTYNSGNVFDLALGSSSTYYGVYFKYISSSQATTAPAATTVPASSTSTPTIDIDKTSVSVTLSKTNAQSGYIMGSGVTVTNNLSIPIYVQTNSTTTSPHGLSSLQVNPRSSANLPVFVLSSQPNGTYSGNATITYYDVSSGKMVLYGNGPSISYTIALTD